MSRDMGRHVRDLREMARGSNGMVNMVHGVDKNGRQESTLRLE